MTLTGEVSGRDRWPRAWRSGANEMAGLSKRIEAAKAWGRRRVEYWRVRRPSVDHWIRTVQRYQLQSGDRLAGAVTYFAFLSFFPLIALAYALLGYVLSNDQSATEALNKAVAEQVRASRTGSTSTPSPRPRRPPGSSVCSACSTPGWAPSTRCAGRCARCR